MNILITGGLGVIGSWVTRQLSDQGEKVITYSRHLDTTLVSDIADRIEMIRGDVLDLPTLIRTIKDYKIRRICHLAALLSEATQANPWFGFQVDAVGTLNVLEAARIMEVERVVFTSSMAVFAPGTGEYGHPTYKPVDEDYPKYPDSKRNGVYGTAKLASEFLCLHYYQDYGLDYVILRFSPLYGIGRLARHGRIAIYNKMIENAMLGQPTIIPRGGEQKTDLVYTKDAARGVVLACFVQNPKHRIFHIASGKAHKLEDMVNAVRKIYPDAVFEIGPGLDHLGSGNRYYVLDISRARDELGYSPKYSLEEGVRDYVETMKRLRIKPTYSP